MTGTNQRQLEIDGISKRYGDTVAVEELSFDVRAGELFGFVGRNGAGKTTTMRIVLGVLAADRGEVRWSGRPLDFKTRRRIGYMPEERGLYPKMRIAEQLTCLGELHGMAGRDAAAAALQWLERFDLAERRNAELQTLSLGNQQRIQLAAALVFSPEVLVLDEPFAGLDPVAVDVLTEVLRERAKAGVAVIFSSHELELVERICDRVGIIRTRLLTTGSVESLRSGFSRKRTAVRLQRPTEELVAAVKQTLHKEGVELSGDRLLIDVEDPDRENPDITEAVVAAGGRVIELSQVSPSLEEVYLKLVHEENPPP